MRFSKMAEIVERLSNSSVGPVAAHVVDATDISLPPGSRLAPEAVGAMPVASGLYQAAFLIEWNAPDQGDGSPPSINMHLNGVTPHFQGIAADGDPLLLYQGGLGPQKIIISDLVYIPVGGTLAISLGTENSAFAGTDAPAATIDRLIVSLIG